MGKAASENLGKPSFFASQESSPQAFEHLGMRRFAGRCALLFARHPQPHSLRAVDALRGLDERSMGGVPAQRFGDCASWAALRELPDWDEHWQKACASRPQESLWMARCLALAILDQAGGPDARPQACAALASYASRPGTPLDPALAAALGRGLAAGLLAAQGDGPALLKIEARLASGCLFRLERAAEKNGFAQAMAAFAREAEPALAACEDAFRATAERWLMAGAARLAPAESRHGKDRL